MKYPILFYILPIAFLILSCEGDIANEIDSKIVIEGWIATDDYPVVIVSTTLPVTSEVQDSASIASHIIRWAKVEISDGERTEVLMGKYDKNYMPPYIYTTSYMKGEPGKTYTLKVTWDKYVATASSTLMESVPIDSISQEYDTQNNVFRLFAHFHDPADTNYYCMFFKIGSEAQQFNKCGVGAFDDNGLNEFTKYPIYKTNSMKNKYKNLESFNYGDTICVRLATIDKTSFNFWSEYQNSTSLSGIFIMPYTKNIPGNINGGYGSWTAFGASDKWIILN